MAMTEPFSFLRIHRFPSLSSLLKVLCFLGAIGLDLSGAESDRYAKRDAIPGLRKMDGKERGIGAGSSKDRIFPTAKLIVHCSGWDCREVWMLARLLSVFIAQSESD
jgi:hypothetical protein